MRPQLSVIKSHGYHPVEQEFATSKTLAASSWIEQVLQRFAVLFLSQESTRRKIFLENMPALIQIWGEKYLNWRLTQEEIDLAVDLCASKWKKIPSNITKEFSEMLDVAIRKIAQRKKPKVIQQEIYSPEEKAYGKVFLRLRDKMQDESVIEVFATLAKFIDDVRLHNPDDTEIEIYRRIWAMIDDGK